eukprot:2773882-Karenia_brevis.AAC.1
MDWHQGLVPVQERNSSAEQVERTYPLSLQEPQGAGPIPRPSLCFASVNCETRTLQFVPNDVRSGGGKPCANHHHHVIEVCKHVGLRVHSNQPSPDVVQGVGQAKRK